MDPVKALVKAPVKTPVKAPVMAPVMAWMATFALALSVSVLAGCAGGSGSDPPAENASTAAGAGSPPSFDPAALPAVATPAPSVDALTNRPDEAASPSAPRVSVVFHLHGGATAGELLESGLRLDCDERCAGDFATDITLTLQAAPKPGHVFAGWGGACANATTECRLTPRAGQVVIAAFDRVPADPALAPRLLYTDLVSGPTTGGEHGKGAYLSLFGHRLGAALGAEALGKRIRVYVGAFEVDTYRLIGISKGRADIEQLTVQLGELGQPTPGVPLPIKISVDGVASNNDLRFTPNPGRILFVDNLAGDDTSARPDDITRPWRTVQTPALDIGGAWPEVRAGDLLVLRGRGAAAPWTDVGFEGYFIRFKDKSGSAPGGVAGTGPIALIGYPGEDVFIRGTLAGGMTEGCVSGVNGSNFPGMGQWVVVANLRIDCEGYDGPVNQQIDGHHWRVINNDLAASTAPRTGASVPRMAGIGGNGRAAVWHGNRIHDIQGSDEECHGIYVDGDGDFDIGYNLIHDIRDGNGIQFYADGGNGSDRAGRADLHHNEIRTVSKHGINLADGSADGLRIWSNLVHSTRLSGLRLNSNRLLGLRVYANTFHAINLAAHPLNGAVINDWTLPDGAFELRDNLFEVAAGSAYVSGTVPIAARAAVVSNNLWFGAGAAPDLDRLPLAAGPRFVAPGLDFRLRADSPAIGRGMIDPVVDAWSARDHGGALRRLPGELGAWAR